MSKTVFRYGLPLGVAVSFFVSQGAFAEVESETAYVFNSLLFLISGMVVMFMAAGFCMLEAGMVRSRNAATICVKNIALYAVAGLMFAAVGYNLMYSGVVDYMGTIGLWGPDDAAALGEVPDFSSGYASSSDWFFQMVFCATAASIVSGTVAERIKIWPFMIFVVILTGIMYPITGSWVWGGGWLSEMGFSDFAGSTLVHSVGGWAAITGAIVLGARDGRYGPGGVINPMPGSNMPMATLGTFILWLGWFGFNGGSQLALGSAADAASIANIFANTNTAAAAGVVVAMGLSNLLYSKIDLGMTLNGAIGGLVAITAEPLAPTMMEAAFIGAIGGVIIVIVTPLIEKLRIDDVVGAIPAHLFCGIFGTLIVPLSNADASYKTQTIGVAAIGAFTLIVSLALWIALRITIGLRASPAEQADGLDHAELGMKAYPDFQV